MSVEIGKGIIVELVIFRIIKTTTTTTIIIIIIMIIIITLIIMTKLLLISSFNILRTTLTLLVFLMTKLQIW